MNRKIDHIHLAKKSQIDSSRMDTRLNYEPLLSGHPRNLDQSVKFLGKHMKYPLWISSMTGGADQTQEINERLARTCQKYSLGMGLGSIRKILDNDKLIETFNLRPILGDTVPFIANLGIAQVEIILKEKKISKLKDVLKFLAVDALMIHINPLQEWMQSEGDRYYRPPFETIIELATEINLPLGIKEVGQGFGPKSIKKLLTLPVEVFEFGAFGGTNFTYMELLRRNDNKYLDVMNPLCTVGHDTVSMVNSLQRLLPDVKKASLSEIIISGGVKTWKDGIYLVNKLKRVKTDLELSIVFGQAFAFLEKALISEEALDNYVDGVIQGLDLYKCFLTDNDE